MSFIAVDAYGGDYAPDEIIKGSVDALNESDDLSIILSGYKDEIKRQLKKYTYDKGRLLIEDAEDVVGMADKPSSALRKNRSSMAVGINLVKEKKADAFVTAGNSGAAMALSMFMLGRIKGVSRPAIAALLPSLEGNVLLLDVGANVDCKPVNLLEFAIMGNVYVKYMLGILLPKVGILNNGSEPGKGNKLSISAYELLEQSRINFIGNVEGNEIFKDVADVVVCDGFVGNIVLKTSESVPHIVAEFLKEEIKKSFWYKVGFLLAKPAVRLIKQKVDYSEFGGAPLLGIDGVCIISHGRSDAVAVKNAILKAYKFSKENINSKIESACAECNVLEKQRKVGNDEG